MIRPEPGVPLATTSSNIRKGLTPISRARSCAEPGASVGVCGRARRLLLATLIGFSCSALRARSAAAEPAGAHTVVIVFEPHTEAMSQRLRQEIEAMGFAVELQPESADSASLDRLAEGSSAIAAIRVKPLEAGGVEMTVLDRATGKTVHRELGRVSASDPAGEELVATRTVELFRASLMELGPTIPPAATCARPSVCQRASTMEAEQQLRRNAGVLSFAAGPTLCDAEVAAVCAVLAGSIVGFERRVSVSTRACSARSRLRASRARGLGRSLCHDVSRRRELGPGTEVAAVSGRLSAGWSLSRLSLRG